MKHFEKDNHRVSNTNYVWATWCLGALVANKQQRLLKHFENDNHRFSNTNYVWATWCLGLGGKQTAKAIEAFEKDNHRVSNTKMFGQLGVLVPWWQINGEGRGF